MNPPPLDVIKAKWEEISRREKLELECKQCPTLCEENGRLREALRSAAWLIHASFCNGVSECIKECREAKETLAGTEIHENG